MAHQRQPDTGFDAFKVGEYIGVPHSKHPVPAFAQPAITFGVICRLLKMLPAIQFNDELVRTADEVCNEWADWFLPVEFEACQTPVVEVYPQNLLCVGGSFSEPSSLRKRFR